MLCQLTGFHQVQSGKPFYLEVKAKAMKAGKADDESLLTKLMLDVKVPTFDFHKAGLADALALLIPMVKERGGMILQRLEEMELPEQLSMLKASTLRRFFDQTCQEFIVDKCYLELFPLLDEGLDALGLIGPVAKKVKTFLYAQVEDKIRLLLHDKVVELYDNLSNSMQVPGCGVEYEDKREAKAGFKDAEQEDEFGYVAKGGGWEKEKKKRRGSGPGSPMAFANQIVSPEIVAQLKAITGGDGEEPEETEESEDKADGEEEAANGATRL